MRFNFYNDVFKGKMECHDTLAEQLPLLWLQKVNLNLFLYNFADTVMQVYRNVNPLLSSIILGLFLMQYSNLIAQCPITTIEEGEYSATGAMCKKSLKNSYGQKYDVQLKSGEWKYMSLDGVLYKKGSFLIQEDASLKNGVWEFYNEEGKVFVKLRYTANKPTDIMAIDSGVAYAGKDSVRVYSPDSIHLKLCFAEKGMLKTYDVEEFSKWLPYENPKQKPGYKPTLGVVGLKETESDVPPQEELRENVFWTDEEMYDRFPEVLHMLPDTIAQSSVQKNLILNPQFHFKSKPLKDGNYVLSPKVVDNWTGGLESPDVFTALGITTLGFRSGGQNFEIIRGEISEPLQKDSYYCFSCQFKLKEKRIYALNRMGAWISDLPGYGFTEKSFDDRGVLVVPNDNTPMCLRDTWMTVQGVFKARGNEKFVYFGHFSDETTLRHWALDSIYTNIKNGNEIYYYFRNPFISKIKNDSFCECTRNECEIIVPPKPIETDSFTLWTDFFEPGKSVLNQETSESLDSLVRVLEDFPSYTLEIDCFTGLIPNAKEAMSLTDKRAKAIAAYFTAAGVEKKRILAVGKGDAEPELVPEQKESETSLSWVVLKIVKRPEIIEP